ncbi:MAG TPA: RHS repeat-associated core domain-containing protein [Gemmatimonadaceae bacterium]|nr:RHS repeat-associated core domain-containing protein [Gemmatimonadaceae bacterium]
MKSIQKLATELTAVHVAILVIGCIGALGFAGAATDRLVLPPTVDVSSTNPGPLLERDLCLTISVGDGAASECGDLRLVHELPGVRTLSKERAPVLIYSSGNARPFPIVAANVALPSGVAGLSTVVATLKVNGLERARGAWTGAAWPNASAVRIALGYDASADPTNIYRYTLDVTASYGATSVTGTAAGEVAVVNRRASYFGSGWWLAGLDQLILDPQGAPGIWIGGDGSIRRYKPAGTNAWTAPSLDRLDTLKRDGAGYARILPGGVKVRFDSVGRHIATRNRLGYETTFSYDLNGRLDHIAVPFGASNYQFHYGASGQLRTIDAPSVPGVARTTTIYQNGARVDSIADADSTRVRFQYPNTSSGVVTGRTNRLGAKTMFAFDIAQKLVSSKLRVGLGDSIYTTLRPKESTGMATSAGTGAVDTVLAYTRIDGPRSDVADTTLFWLDRFGSPVRIRNAVGAMTSVTRGDSRFPVLATQLVDPGGVVTTAQYDARGNPQSVTTTNPYGDGRNVVTAYQWDATWDEVTSITLPEGEVTTFQYDAANGNRLWQQQGTDVSRRVHFYYGNSYSLPSSIEVPDIAGRDSVEYDSRGNPLATISPSGIRTTYNTDAVGRDTLRLLPIDGTRSAHERITYDPGDRVKTSTSFGPTMPKTPMYSSETAPADSVIVTNSYDAEGNLLQVSRSRGVLYPGYAPISTYYAYDSAGRKISENLFGTAEKYIYDPAGNLVRLITARSDSILMTYDAANRLIQRVVPRVTYSQTSCQTFYDGSCFYTYPEREGPNLCIAADTAGFGYDAPGRMIRADNGSARVRRTYFPNGALKTDTAKLAKYAGPCAPMPGDDAFVSHSYGLALTYDLDGRRSTLSHPAQYCQLNGCMDRYTYDRSTSALDTLTDSRGNIHTFAYDLGGRLVRRGSPGNVVDEFTYDSESNLIAHAVHAPNGSDYLSDNSVFDQRGKMVSAHTSGPQGSADILLAYSGLGAVTATEQQGTIGGFTSEAFTVDALGNRSERKQTSDTYDPGDQFRHRTFRYNTWNQLEGIDGEPQAPPYNNYYAETYAYDPAGNTTLFHKNTNETGGGGLITYNDSPLIRVGEGHASLASGKGGPNASGFDEAVETRYDQVYHQESHISYYGADNKLRVFNRHVGFWMTSADSLYGDRGVFEEYRYDALGRRVLTRTRRIGGGCPGTLDCQSRATRAVWDGDRILYEIRSPGGEVEMGSPPDTVPDPGIEGELTVIGYTHAIGVSGIDEPVAILASQSIFPHTGWRGMLAMGTYANGAESDCPVVNPCDRIDWPGSDVTIDRRGYGRDEPSAWYGTLASSAGEGSGLQYMRNRYYDPTRGQFTQADPIGLGGGLNLYGFANGDPINGSDPFGLCPACATLVFGAELAAPEIGPGTVVAVGLLATAGVVWVWHKVHNEEAGKGSVDGPTAGRAATKKEREAARARNREANEGELRCVHCGVETTEEPGHPTSSQIDHVQPRRPRDGGARGNNNPENLKNSCRTCNLKKSNQRPPFQPDQIR